MTSYHLDYETFSAANLNKYGHYRYASDVSTEILLCAVCRDDGPVEIWDRYASARENAAALSILQDMVMEEDALIYAHNAPFEIAISKYLWESTFGFKRPHLQQWRCTAALCRVAAIPASLEKAAIFLNLDDQKDAAGKALIKVFSIPRKNKARGEHRVTPADLKAVTVAGVKVLPADAWASFRQYCIKDVLVERQIEHRLKPLALKGTVLESFIADLHMADRGIPVDTGAVGNAEVLINQYNTRLGDEFTGITGLGASQTTKVLEWLRERGYPGDNLQAGTISRITGIEVAAEEDEEEDTDAEFDVSAMTPECWAALRIRALLSFAAIKKIPTMREAACPDGRVRGAMVWWGAARTGRGSSKVVQVHNMKRPTINTDAWQEQHGEPETHAVFRLIRDGKATMELFDEVFGPPLECVASSIRHFIGDRERQFMDIDLAQIEARVLAWVSGHTELLQAFREGKDLYKATASLIWGTPYSEVSKDERFLGKVASLACGYNGGVDAFTAMARIYGVDTPPEKAAEVVKAYRSGNKPITRMWKDCGTAMVNAIKSPGEWFDINDKVRVGVTNRLGYPCMQVELPSGRRLSYPYPEAETVYKIQDQTTKKWVNIPERRALDATGEKRDGVWVTHQVSYHGQIKGKSFWGRVTTHGGVLVENICQAIAGDFLTNGVLTAEKAGYIPVFTVHDQGIFEYHPERGNTLEGLTKAITTVPSWAKGFPLAAEAAITDFFTK